MTHSDEFVYSVEEYLATVGGGLDLVHPEACDFTVHATPDERIVHYLTRKPACTYYAEKRDLASDRELATIFALMEALLDGAEESSWYELTDKMPIPAEIDEAALRVIRTFFKGGWIAAIRHIVARTREVEKQIPHKEAS